MSCSAANKYRRFPKLVNQSMASNTIELSCARTGPMTEFACTDDETSRSSLAMQSWIVVLQKFQKHLPQESGQMKLWSTLSLLDFLINIKSSHTMFVGLHIQAEA